VSQTQFSDAALVLIGHGSTVSAESAAPVYQHAAALRSRALFGQVHEAFWKQTPRLQEVVSGLAAQRIFLVPMFISAGYFSEEVIPQALGFSREQNGSLNRVQQRGGQTLYYCHPIGTHPGMTAILLSRAREVVRHGHPTSATPEQMSLFIAGHGTAENENSRKAIEHQVELIRAQRAYRSVEAVFIEEDPRIVECYRLAQTANIIVVPFFMSEGMHTRRDIPILLGAPEAIVNERFRTGLPTWHNPTELNNKLVWYTASIGNEPQIAGLILERVLEAAKSPIPNQSMS